MVCFILCLDLVWWLEKIGTVKDLVPERKFHTTIFTDAPRSGWGAFSEGARANGWWSADETEKHINFLELQAVLYVLKCFANHLDNCNILIKIYNTTAIAYLKRMGGIRYPKLSNLSREIWP